MAIKLYYFGLPGRAEVARLCLHIADKEVDDMRFSFADWPQYKPKMPFGQAPVLEVDGKMLAQSGAIDRYAASLGGLVPSDPWQAALADQAYCFCADLIQPLYDTFKLKELDDKIKARQAALEGPMKEKLTLATKLVEGAGSGFLTGKDLSYGDVQLFVTLSTIVSGWMDGVPKTLLNDWPALKAYRNRVAAHPKVKAYYERPENQDEVRLAFKPDA